MSESKTLNEIVNEDGDVSGDILKAKVVKWIKDDRGLQKDNTIYRISNDELFDLLEERWMKRLNITEEDLK